MQMTKKLLLLIPLFFAQTLQAQTVFTATADNSSVKILGTSSVHDWESVVETFTLNLTASIAESNIPEITSLTFEADVESIKSGKRIMDNKTKDALKAKDHPKISFSMAEVVEVTGDAITVSGELTIAGSTNTVQLTAAYTLTNGSLAVSGQQVVLMSDFGIKPPTAMLGSLKTGDEVTIEFILNLTD